MFAEKVYRALFVAYAREFQSECGELMMQFPRERMRCAGEGSRGLVI